MKSKFINKSVNVFLISSILFCSLPINAEENVINITIKKSSSDKNTKSLDYYNNKNFKKAIEVLNTEIQINKKDSNLYNLRGLSYLGLGNSIIDYKSNIEESESKLFFSYLQKAKNDFSKSIELNSKNYKSYNNLAMCYIKLSNFMIKEINTKLKEFENIKSLSKKFTNERFDMSSKEVKELENHIKNITNVSQELLKISKDYLEKAKKISPNNPETYNVYSYYYIENENYKLAEDNSKKSISIDSKNDEFYNTLGLVYIVNKKFDLAEKNFKKSIELNNKSDAAKNLIIVYWSKEEYQKTLDALNNLVVNLPEDNSSKHLYNSFLTSYILIDQDNAIKTLRTKVEENPDNNTFKEILSNTYKILGAKAFFDKDSDKSILYLTQALELNPQDESKIKSILNLSYTQSASNYAKKGNFDKAIEIYKKALEDKPNDGISILGLVDIYKRQGNYDEALLLTEKRLEKDPNFAPIHYELAKIYALKNEKEKSLKYLKNAIIFDKKNKNKAKNEPELRNIKNEQEYKKMIL